MGEVFFPTYVRYDNNKSIRNYLSNAGGVTSNGLKKQIFDCNSVYLWKLFDHLKKIIQFKDDYFIRLEYPNTTNTWHKGGKGAALNVGKNQAIAIIIKDFLDCHKLNYELLKPSGYSLFFKDVNMFQQTTKWQGRTNEDVRAACAMCWGY